MDPPPPLPPPSEYDRGQPPHTCADDCLRPRRGRSAPAPLSGHLCCGARLLAPRGTRLPASRSSLHPLPGRRPTHARLLNRPISRCIPATRRRKVSGGSRLHRQPGQSTIRAPARPTRPPPPPFFQPRPPADLRFPPPPLLRRLCHGRRTSARRCRRRHLLFSFFAGKHACHPRARGASGRRLASRPAARAARRGKAARVPV